MTCSHLVASLALALAALSVGACARSSAPVDAASDFDPCGSSDHPCSLAGVTAEADDRTHVLTIGLLERAAAVDDLDAAVAWLRAQDGVASVATGSGVVRFRVNGGVGHWVFLQTLDTFVTLGGAVSPSPAPQGITTEPSPVFNLDRMRSLVARQDDPSGQSLDTRRGRERKKALLLSPFRWQWEISNLDDGIDEVARVLRARDYRPEDVTVITEALDLDNPACRSEERWRECRTDQGFSSPTATFTSWNDYEYIHLLTHGGRVEVDSKFMTAVMTPWTRDAVEAERARHEPGWFDQVWAFLESNEESEGDAVDDLFDRVGVETASIQIKLPSVNLVPEVRPGQTVRSYVPLAEVSSKAEAPLNPQLSESERSACEQSLAARADVLRHQRGENLAATAGGKPCRLYMPSVATGRFIMLTSRFFRATYPRGVDDAVILISACSSGGSSESPATGDLLAAVRGERTAAIGWKNPVSITAAAGAGTLLARALVEVDDTIEPDSGLAVRQAITRLNELIENIHANPPSFCSTTQDPAMAGKCVLYKDVQGLSVINDLPADSLTGASLIVEGDDTVRAREVAYLVEPGGAELTDGAEVFVRGVPGDSQPDEVSLTLRVDGLGLEPDPRAVKLSVIFEGRESPVDRPLESQVAPGVWEVGHRLPIGRDHTPDERITLEVKADLPGGLESRWTYRNLRLVGCYWTGEVSGHVSRQIGGHGVSFGRTALPGGAMDGPATISSITLGQTSTARAGAVATPASGADSMTFFLAGEIAERDFRFEESPSGHQAWIGLGGTPLFRPNVNRGQVRITLYEPQRLVVGGFAVAYKGATIPDFEPAALEIRGTFVWTPACPTVWDELNDLGQRTADFLRERGIE